MPTYLFHKKNRQLALAIFSSIIFFLSAFYFANAQSLGIPCGNNIGNMCEFKHLIILAQNIMNFMILITLPLAAIGFAWAGWLYLSAGGNSGKITQAHEIFKKVFWGFVFVLSAWLIVYTITNALLNPANSLNFLKE